MSYASRRKERISKIISEVYKRIDSDILNEADSLPGVKIGIEDFMKSDPNKLGPLANKATINVVDKPIQEADTQEIVDVTNDLIIKDRKVYILVDVAGIGEQVQFTSKNKKYTAVVSDEPKGTSEDKYLLKDIKLVKENEPELEGQPLAADTAEEKQVEDTQQEQAVYNLKAWATQLQLQIGDGETAPNRAVKFTYFSQESQQPINILVLSNGLIKMSGHTIQDFEDLKDIVNFHKNG